MLLAALQEAGGGYEILFDRKHLEAAPGSSLPLYIQQIDAADAVLVVLTPKYKERVRLTPDAGVSQEFRRIHDRLLRTEANQTYGRSFLLLPLVYSGSHAEACPPEICHLVATSVTWLHADPRAKTPTVRRQLRPKLKEASRALTQRMSAIAATKKAAYLQREKELFRTFLFFDTKSRWDQPESSSFLEAAFVKTSTFRRIKTREANFVVGRKGEGKSTIAHVLPHLLQPKPDAVLAIDFEQFPWHACFHILRDKPAEASDLRHAASPLLSYQLIWDAFFHLHHVWATRDAFDTREQPRRLLHALLSRSAESMSEASEVQALATKTLFTYAFERLLSYVDLVARAPSVGGGVAGLPGQFSPTPFREHLFTRPGWKRLDDHLRSATRGGQRYLVTADGFDTMVGYFTTVGPDAPAALQFERELLLALFQLVQNKGPGKIPSQLYQLSDFCITVPYDRFIEARDLDRDRYTFRHAFARIAWSGIELAALVRKRLALLREVEDKDGDPAAVRLAKVMQKGYSELPSEVSFPFGSARYRMSLFLYVLRHTFWRPRDVLCYYASLLAACESSYRNKDEAVGTEFVRQVVSGVTHSIVRDEFLTEFQATFSNLPDVIRRFQYGPQVLSWEQLGDRLMELRFNTSLMRGEPNTLEEKVEILYAVGFLGVVLDAAVAERLHAHRYAFVFNEDQLLTERLGRDEYPSKRFAIHPVFCEFLSLDTQHNPGLVLDLDWEYLDRNQVLRGIVPA